MRRWGRERWPGSFEPIVSEKLFARVQAVLAGKAVAVTPYQRNHPDFPLRRFITCTACGVPLTAARAASGSREIDRRRRERRRAKAGEAVSRN